jgi:hypothetical protein
MKTEKIRLKIISEYEEDNTSEEIEMPPKEYMQLHNKYGIYGLHWYFVNQNTIKYFNNNEWFYDKVYIL